MSAKHELQNIIFGNGEVRNGKNIQAIALELRRKKEAISGVEKYELNKNQEKEFLIEYTNNNKLWFGEIHKSKYIGEGAEQKIYEFSDPKFILKLNDTLFYEYWIDYFHNLLIHNYFFPHLAYEFLGFVIENNCLFSVVKQPYVVATESTNLENVRQFLMNNGFVNRKGNDYFNPELGIILEDLHDENVLTSEGVLQFIDTVFFLTPSFFDHQ